MKTLWRSGLLFWMLSMPLACVAETPQDFSGEWVAAGKDAQSKDGQSNDSTGAPTPGSHRGGGHGGGMTGGGMGGMGGGRGGMAGGGRHHSGGSSLDGSNNAATAGPGGDPRVAAQALTIRQSDVVFDVAADGGRRMVYRFDNRNNYGAAYGGTVTLTWAAPEMVIETHPDAGGSIEEHYALSDDGRKLSLRIHEQRAGSETARDFTRTFVRSGTPEAATSSTLP